MERKKAGEDLLSRKDSMKALRTVMQIVLMAAALMWVIWQLQRVIATGEKEKTAFLPAAEGIGLTSQAASGAAWATDGEPRFICVSYNGITESEKPDSRIVSKRDFDKQLAALKASGYVTVTQQDILDCFAGKGTLPRKAMLLLFEDGIYSSAALAQPTLEKHNYKASMCTYAGNLTDGAGHYITTENIRSLMDNTYWELGSNGYRLSYINVFDRYGNAFGSLNLDEFVHVHEYLKRDYNHYLMDFIRDEDRLRTESEEQMKRRIDWDYDQMRAIYAQELGFVPPLYVLMHANTRAFATDPVVSDENERKLTDVFGMNFNRQGSCLNTTQASIFDLTRLQARSYFSTNHLMMRIWDDTGDDVAFFVGDAEGAAHWYVDEGAAEFDNDEKILLTTMPGGVGRMTLRDELPADIDLTVTLQGNIVGRQSIFLRSDRTGARGIEVALEDNVLLVRESGGEPVFSLDLFSFDGGPFISEQEDELCGLIALQEALIAFDPDPARVKEAEKTLAELKMCTPLTLEEGGTPYIPALDISDRGNRRLRILLAGDRLSLWVDDRQAAEDIAVQTTDAGSLVLEAGVSQNNERFSQTNLDDDVYDAVFAEMRVRDAQSGTLVFSYAPPEPESEIHPFRAAVERAIETIVNVF